MTAQTRKHHDTLSPSSFPMFAKCPCFHSGEAGEAAESGTRQHALLEQLLQDTDGAPDGMACTPEEEEQVLWAANYIHQHTGESLEVEKRLSLIGNDFEEITFGTMDVVAVVSQAAGNILTVFDYKSGEQRDYKPQMAVYARMAMLAYGHTRCDVHEVYGRLRWYESYSLALRDTDFVMDIIASVQNPDKAPVCCEYCSWCRHQGTCAAATAPIIQVATEYEPDGAVAALPLRDVVNWHASQITDPGQMSIVLRVAEHLGKWSDAVKAHARDAALTGMVIPGYILKEGRRVREFSDPLLAFEASGLELRDFLECCKVSVPKVAGKMAVAAGHSSANVKAAKDDFNNAVGNFVFWNEGAPTLSREAE